MTEIRIVTDSPLPAERVLAAGHDFSPRRAEIFPAVRTRPLRRPRAWRRLGRRHRRHAGRNRDQLGTLPLRLVATRLGHRDGHQLQRLRRAGQQLGTARDAHGRRQPGGDDLAYASSRRARAGASSERSSGSSANPSSAATCATHSRTSANSKNRGEPGRGFAESFGRRSDGYSVEAAALEQPVCVWMS